MACAILATKRGGLNGRLQINIQYRSEDAPPIELKQSYLHYIHEIRVVDVSQYANERLR